MPTSLTLNEHLGALRDAVTAFARYADRAGLEAAVPTCPDWTVRHLIGHQGMVHRWASAHLRGEEIGVEATERAGRRSADPVAWLREGAEDLVRAIEATPPDLRTVVFLNDAPPPREFWARRQCHETTIHAVDALAAALGRYPTAADTWIDPAVALDGIDELLQGFLTRNKSRLRTAEPTRVGVLVTGERDGWLVAVSDRPPTCTRAPRAEVAQSADAVLEGSAVAVYLTVWNRSDELEVVGGDPAALDPWKAAGITWS